MDESVEGLWLFIFGPSVPPCLVYLCRATLRGGQCWLWYVIFVLVVVCFESWGLYSCVGTFFQVLVKMLNLAVERLETNRYMTPDEKYRNIRVVPHLLW